jgi:glycosyltransferase involved in cell wall biosynthesis
MNLQGQTILHAAQYAAPYEGNFIKSLKNLELHLQHEGAKMVYVFPQGAKTQPWFSEFAESHEVYAYDTTDIEALQLLLGKVRPAIVHCHFEGFDVPMVKATKKIVGYQPKMVWHLHDWFHYHKNPLKALYMRWGFFKHYCLNAKGVSVIGVCEEITDFVSRFKRLSGSDFYRKKTILNGIDTNRIEQPEISSTSHNPFTFLSFGRKRVDVLFAAFKRIFDKMPTAPYRLILTDGPATRQIIDKMAAGVVPNWCHLVQQTDNISSVFAQADCFISSADFETFSYAVCEASIYGLPVIQTNIPGTKWNNDNPSTFLFSPGCVDELAECIKQVADTYQQLTEARLKTRQNNLTFVVDNWSKQIIKYYRDL